MASRDDPRSEIEKLAHNCYLAMMNVADAGTKLPDDATASKAATDLQEAKNEACAAIAGVAKKLDMFLELGVQLDKERVQADIDAAGASPVSSGGEIVRRSVNPLDNAEGDS